MVTYRAPSKCLSQFRLVVFVTYMSGPTMYDLKQTVI